MIPCFGSWNHKSDMLPFKAFESMRNHEKEFYTREYCVQIRCQLYFTDMNHMYSLN